VHIIETLKMGDTARRCRLAHVMAEISEGWTIAPAQQINVDEFRMAVPKVLNRAVFIKPPIVFGRGIEFAYGLAAVSPFLGGLDSADEATKRAAIHFLELFLGIPNERLRKSGVDKHQADMNAFAAEAERVRNLVISQSRDYKLRAFTGRFTYDYFRNRGAELHEWWPIGILLANGNQSSCV
jgi:hypothetical protein